ncbi:MAG: hypothetical protein R3E68_01030 [Burkholderiaceae bacterium]
MQDALQWDERTDSSLRLPFWIYYSALSTGFALHALFVLNRFHRLLTGTLVLETGDLIN